MDKKEFILPGVILGLVLITAIGLLLTYKEVVPQIGTPDIATSTVSTTTSTKTTKTTTTTPTGTRGPSGYYPYGTVVLALNQVAGFQNGVSIRPVEVLEDSRCPANANCVWAGTLKLSLKVSKNNVSSVLTPSLGETVTYEGLSITFSEAAPLGTTSGKPADSAYRFTFVTKAGTAAAAECYVGGCSGEVCSDKPDAVSNCMYRPEYGCYKKSVCERQTTGKCGWTQTTALTQCLANPEAAS